MRRHIIPWILLFVLVFAGGWYGWMQQIRRSVVLRHLPAAPIPTSA